MTGSMLHTSAWGWRRNRGKTAPRMPADRVPAMLTVTVLAAADGSDSKVALSRAVWLASSIAGGGYMSAPIRIAARKERDIPANGLLRGFDRAADYGFGLLVGGATGASNRRYGRKRSNVAAPMPRTSRRLSAVG